MGEVGFGYWEGEREISWVVDLFGYWVLGLGI